MLHLLRMKKSVAGLALSLVALVPTTIEADNLGVLGAKPKWDVHESYQKTITHDDFAYLVNDVYCTHGFADDLIKIDAGSARILKNRDAQTFFTLRFAADE